MNQVAYWAWPMSSILDASKLVGRKHLGGSAIAYMTLNKPFNFSEPSFSICKMKSPSLLLQLPHSFLVYSFVIMCFSSLFWSSLLRGISPPLSVPQLFCACGICKKVTSARAFLFLYMSAWFSCVHSWLKRNSCLGFLTAIIRPHLLFLKTRIIKK